LVQGIPGTDDEDEDEGEEQESKDAKQADEKPEGRIRTSLKSPILLMKLHC